MVRAPLACTRYAALAAALAATALVTAPTASGVPTAQSATADRARSGWAQLGSTRYVAPAGAIHVATTGRDTASGTSARPLRTISQAVRRAGSGATIVVHGGVYHESVTIDRASGITIQPAGTETVWLDGSRAVTNWARSGSGWVATGWRAEFDSSPTYSWGAPDNPEDSWTFVNRDHPMAAHPDQLWVDDVPQRQVGSLSQLGPGRFYVDDAADRLYLGSNPAGRTVRASDIAKAISVRAARTVIRGIGVRRFAPSVPHMGAVTLEAPYTRLDNVVIHHISTTALHVMRHGIRLNRVTLAYNGMLGMSGTHADDLVMTRVQAAWNNRERFNTSPVSGGAKIGRSERTTIRGSRFAHNYGPGLWFDESAWDVRVTGSSMVRNARHGISLELSGKAVLADNIIGDNGGNGIKINDSNQVHLWNNTLAGNARPINVVQDYRDVDPGGSYRNYDLPLTYRNGPLTIRNNIVARPGSGGNCMVCVEDYSGRWSAAQMKISTHANLYQRGSSGTPSWLVVWSRGSADPSVFTALADFRRATGQEQRGYALQGPAAVTSSYAATWAVRSRQASVAVPLPRWLARQLGRPTGTRHLGAWR